MKQFIIKDIQNNLYFAEIDNSFDLDIKEARFYPTKEDAESFIPIIERYSNFDRILEVKEVFKI